MFAKQKMDYSCPQSSLLELSSEGVICQSGIGTPVDTDLEGLIDVSDEWII